MKAARRIAVYPGSFDPITMGHRDIMERMAPSFDRVILLISSNRNKAGLFTPEERRDLAREALRDLPALKLIFTRA
jgi:pantetheine-phosphate adenylyltransferase